MSQILTDILARFAIKPEMGLGFADAIAFSGPPEAGIEQNVWMIGAQSEVPEDGVPFADLAKGSLIVGAHTIPHDAGISVLLTQGSVDPSPDFLRMLTAVQKPMFSADASHMSWRLSSLLDEPIVVWLTAAHSGESITLRTNHVQWEFFHPTDQEIMAWVLDKSGTISMVEHLRVAAFCADPSAIKLSPTGIIDAKTFAVLRKNRMPHIVYAKNGGGVAYWGGQMIEGTEGHSVLKLRYNEHTRQLVYLTTSGWMYALNMEEGKKGPRLLAQGLRRPSSSPDILFVRSQHNNAPYHMARVSFLSTLSRHTRYHRADVRLERIWT